MGQSKVTVKGTGQLNGNVNINKTVEMDSVMANKFMGSNRYEVIEAFLNTNYPGVKVNPKNFGVNVVPIKSSSEKSSVSKSSSKSNTKTNKSILSKTGSAVVGTASVIGAIGGFLLNNDDEENEESKKTEDFNLAKEKEKLDLEYYKKQKEFEFTNQQVVLKRSQKKEKIVSIKEEINNGGNKFIGYFSILWTYLDKWWKKALFIYVILMIIVLISESLGY